MAGVTDRVVERAPDRLNADEAADANGADETPEDEYAMESDAKGDSQNDTAVSPALLEELESADLATTTSLAAFETLADLTGAG